MRSAGIKTGCWRLSLADVARLLSRPNTQFRCCSCCCCCCAAACDLINNETALFACVVVAVFGHKMKISRDHTGPYTKQAFRYTNNDIINKRTPFCALFSWSRDRAWPWPSSRLSPSPWPDKRKTHNQHAEKRTKDRPLSPLPQSARAAGLCKSSVETRTQQRKAYFSTAAR